MNSDRYQPNEKYKKFLLNRVTARPHVIEYIENSLIIGDENSKRSLHKIMIHNWADSVPLLFDTLMGYFTTTFLPVNYSVQGDLTTFYVENLNLVSKIIKFDFMFPYSRNMFSVDILLNDKTSSELFGESVTLEEIVTGVVSRRFDQNCALDLSNFCNDTEFVNKKIIFYKLSLLSFFKILMLRMGRDTKLLNLSNNNLSQAPLEILNFFIKADLTAVDLSNNNIPSISDLLRLSSKIEKLWIEGNPLCEDIDPVTYVKTVAMKFPRLNELDGIKLNEHGVSLPFIRNYICIPGEKPKMVVDKFLTLYFSHYDSSNRAVDIRPFYHSNAELTISTNITVRPNSEDISLSNFIGYSRNILPYSSINRAALLSEPKHHKSGDLVASIHGCFPVTIHDPSTFTVDVILHNGKYLVLIVDGVFQQKTSAVALKQVFFQFRRTFKLKIMKKNGNITLYLIRNEMFSFNYATEEQINHSFKNPIRNLNSMMLVNPTSDEADSICQVLQHITQLKKSEVELRLKYHNWNIGETINDIITDLRNNRIMPELFLDDDFTDTSSLLDDID